MDGTTFKKYVFEFYRELILTLIYIACDSGSQQALQRAETLIEYFIRLFKMMDFNFYAPEQREKIVERVNT